MLEGVHLQRVQSWIRGRISRWEVGQGPEEGDGEFAVDQRASLGRLHPNIRAHLDVIRPVMSNKSVVLLRVCGGWTHE